MDDAATVHAAAALLPLQHVWTIASWLAGVVAASCFAEGWLNDSSDRMTFRMTLTCKFNSCVTFARVRCEPEAFHIGLSRDI